MANGEDIHEELLNRRCTWPPPPPKPKKSKLGPAPVVSASPSSTVPADVTPLATANAEDPAAPGPLATATAEDPAATIPSATAKAVDTASLGPLTHVAADDCSTDSDSDGSSSSGSCYDASTDGGIKHTGTEIVGWNATYRLKNPEEPTFDVIVKRLQRKSKKYANDCSKLPVSTRHVDPEKKDNSICDHGQRLQTETSNREGSGSLDVSRH